MKALVTGGRDFTDYNLMCEVLDFYHNADPFTVVIHGAAPGADSLASRWAYENQVDVLAYGAKWGRYGGSAGPKRNVVMLRKHPDAVVFAFPTQNSKGTWHCVNHARIAEQRVILTRRE